MMFLVLAFAAGFSVGLCAYACLVPPRAAERIVQRSRRVTGPTWRRP